MSAPESNGDPYRIMRDAAARAEMVFESILDSAEAWDLGGRLARRSVQDETKALKAARTLAESRAKLAAPTPEMGGTTLDLTPEEARKLRALLGLVAGLIDESGNDEATHAGEVVTAHDARAIRKRINAGVSKNAQDRTGLRVLFAPGITPEQHAAALTFLGDLFELAGGKGGLMVLPKGGDERRTEVGK